MQKIHDEQNSKALEKRGPNRAGDGEESGESDRGAVGKRQWRGSGEGSLPSFPLEPLVIAAPPFPTVTSSWGFLLFYFS